jgi:phosphoglucomutase
MDLLAAEILARTGKDPGIHYQELTWSSARPATRASTPCDARTEGKARQAVTPVGRKAETLAGEPIMAKLTRASGNARSDRRPQGRGGQRLVCGAAPRAPRDIYKIYAESFRDSSHLDAIVSEAQEIVNDALVTQR